MEKLINRRYLFLLSVSTIIFFITASFKKSNQENIPIWFENYGVEIQYIDKLGDTILYNKSSKEDFKFVFYDKMGKCYCERYINGKLFEKGNYENSLDTLKKYVSSRNNHGITSPMRVEKYFEPLKNGEWQIYMYGKIYKKEIYVLGIKQ